MNEETLFAEALGKNCDARAAFLDEHCKDNVELRKRLEDLLHANENPDPFLEPPAPAACATLEDPIRERPGTVIGPYKLLQQIGEGGMGVVWMAEQSQPVQRKVALKVIKPGMDSQQVIARFEAERQALAMMDHVYIARVFDAGATEAGLPYFVMELVHGVPITKYCDDNQLTPRERLELFVPVCQAIQHAHQKGVIHRDIKPSNVMVTIYDDKPVPKVIDFGVAKATEQKLTERTLFTHYGTMVGTLEYMSPEQAEISALGVDTRSDIYSLGVLLYELLTGSTPLTSKRMKEAAYAEILRMIKDEEPPKPSTRLSDSGEALASISANRHTEPAKLTKLVKGELDWIVMKTLEKDRNRRYETASAFAADVQRYLNDEAVQACPPSAWYRFRKFARRHKGALAGAAIVTILMLMMLIGLAVSNVLITQEKNAKTEALNQAKINEGIATEQRHEAQANLIDALAAVDQMLTHVAQDRLYDAPHMEPVRRELLQEALSFYQKFLEKNGRNSLIRRETIRAHWRVAEVHLALGQHAEAELDSRKTLGMIEQLAAEAPLEAEMRLESVKAHRLLAGAIWSRYSIAAATWSPARRAEYELHVRMAVKIAEELVQEFPKVAEYSDELVERNLSLVRLLEPDQAEQSAKTLLRNLTLTTSPWRLRKTYIELGSLMLRQKRYVEAEEAFRKAADLQDPCAAERPSDHGQQLYTGIALRGLGDVLAGSARLKEAAEIYARVTQVFDKLAADFPGMVFYRPQQSFSHCRQAEVLDKLGRTDDAERAYRKAFEIEAKAAADFPALSQFREKAWSRCLGLGQFLTKIGQVEAAQEVYAQAPALLEKLEAAPPTRLKHWQGLARTQSKLGEALATKGNAKKAEAAFQDAEAIQDKVDSESPANEGRGELARSQSDAARLLVQAGWLEEGERLGRRALANAKAFAVQSPSRAESRANMARRNQWLGDCLLKLGRFPEAAAEFQQAAAEYAKAADNEPANAELRKQRASIQADLGHIDELIAQTQVIDRNRNSWQAWYRRGNAWLKLRQWEKAIADQTKALELKPDHVWSWYQRAFAYRHLSQLEKALADATKAVELEPQAWGPHSERAHVLIELGRWEQAVVELTSALELNPGSWSTWHRRGQAYRVLGQWDKAAADYAKVLEGEPHSGQAHNDLAHLLAACPDPKSRNPKRAVELARRAVGLTPQEGVYWNTLGIALYRTGNWNAAVKALEKSMKLRQGGDSLDWFFLAMAHWQLGDKGQAREWHDQAVQWLEKNKPQDEELRRFHSEAAELLEVKEESGR